jgi:membrane protease subunit HflK
MNPHLSPPRPPPTAPAAPPGPSTRPRRPPTDQVPQDDAGARAMDDALRSGTRILRVLMALVAGVVLFSGVFTVQPNEVAVVLRFGRPVDGPSGPLRQPGLHWALPYPMDEVVRIPVGQSHSIMSTAGWYLVTKEQEAAGVEPDARASLFPGMDGYVLSADGNIVHARTTLKYRVADPMAYVFRFAAVSNLLQNVLNNALADAAGRFRADAAVYGDKIAFRDAVLDRVREAIDQHRLGITLEPSDVQVVAPLEVRPSFEAVLAAEQERSSKVNEARAYAAEITVKATGEAEALLAGARGGRSQLVAAVAAEADSFSDQLPHFERNPALFARRRLTETLEGVLTNAQDKFLFPSPTGDGSRHLRLQLSREPVKPNHREGARP